MTQRERGDDEEPEEAGKREKLLHAFAQVQAGPSLVNGEQVPLAHVKEEKGDGERGEAQRDGAQHDLHSSVGAQPQFGAQGNAHLSDTDDAAASDEDVDGDENSSDVDDGYYSGDGDDEDCGDDFYEFQEDLHPYFFSLLAQAHTQRSSTKLVPIAHLVPNYYGTWETKGRVVYKSPVLPYDNENGKGTRWWFEMADDAGGEIRVVCFNELIDDFFNKVTKDKWIVLSNGNLKAPHPLHNANRRRCEVILQWNSTIRATPEEPETLAAGDTEKELLRKQVAELKQQLELTNKSLEVTSSQCQDYKSELQQLKGNWCN
jgi:hypothetical protein